MNVILLGPEDFMAADRVRVAGRRARHAAGVLRARAGDVLRVGRIDGPLGVGRVSALTADSLEMEVALDTAPPAPLPVALLLALPRPKVLRRVLQGVTAMGVKRVVLMATWKVEKSYWDSPYLTPAALREAMLLGLEQAGDTVLPQVEMRRRFKPFVEDELPAHVAGTRALVAHPDAAPAVPLHAGEPVTLAVGPEGGFTDYEVDSLAACGFARVSLGPRRLRVEQAVPALLGRWL